MCNFSKGTYVFVIFSSVQTSLGLVTGVLETSPVPYYSYRGIPYAIIPGRFKVIKCEPGKVILFHSYHIMY